MLFFLSLSKSVWHYHQHQQKKPDKDKPVRQVLLKAAAKNPGYGYRPMMRELSEKLKQRIGERRTRRLMKSVTIVGLRKRRNKPGAIAEIIIRLGSKVNLLAARKMMGPPIKIGELVVTDFTRLLYAGGTKTAWLITLIGLTEKVCWGWAVGQSNDTALALVAWQKLKRNRHRWKTKVKDLIVHQDRDPVFTGYEWVGRLAEDGAVFSYTLNGFKGNPEMESFNGHFKGELKSLVADCRTLAEVKKVVARQLRYYNWLRRHSSIDYQPPMIYFKSKRRGKTKRKLEN